MSKFRKIVENVLAESTEKVELGIYDFFEPGPKPEYSILVYVNPSRLQFKGLINKFGEVRGVANDENVIIWPAAEACHMQVRYSLEKEYGEIIEQNDCLFMCFEQNDNILLGYEAVKGHYKPGSKDKVLVNKLLSNSNFTKLFSKKQILNAPSHNAVIG